MTGDLDTRLNALLEKATKGPWCVPGDSGGDELCIWSTCNEGLTRGVPLLECDVSFRSWSAGYGGQPELEEHAANAALIVEAVNALPQLLADRLSDRERIAELERALDTARNQIVALFIGPAPRLSPEQAVEQVAYLDKFRGDSAALGGAKP